MIFDKSKAYSAVNADELKIGSKVIFADNVEELKEKVNEFSKMETMLNLQTLSEIRGEVHLARFTSIESDCFYHFAYLIEEPKYRPFDSSDNVDLVGKKIIYKENEYCKAFITWQNNLISMVHLDVINVSYKELFDKWIFEDGSPCGMKD